MIPLKIKVSNLRGETIAQDPLYLVRVPEITPDDVEPFTGSDTDPRFSDGVKLGEWMAASPYIGKGIKGPYYYKNLHVPKCSREQTWAGQCTRFGGGILAVGFFFDSLDVTPLWSAVPILVLYEFEPLTPSDSYHEGFIHPFNYANVASEVWWGK